MDILRSRTETAHRCGAKGNCSRHFTIATPSASSLSSIHCPDNTTAMKRNFVLLLGLLTFGASSAMLASCTNYVPAKLFMSRSGDTLSVALDPVGGSRWNPTKDSLVVHC